MSIKFYRRYNVPQSIQRILKFHGLDDGGDQEFDQLAHWRASMDLIRRCRRAGHYDTDEKQERAQSTENALNVQITNELLRRRREDGLFDRLRKTERLSKSTSAHA